MHPVITFLLLSECKMYFNYWRKITLSLNHSHQELNYTNSKVYISQDHLVLTIFCFLLKLECNTDPVFYNSVIVNYIDSTIFRAQNINYSINQCHKSPWTIKEDNKCIIFLDRIKFQLMLVRRAAIFVASINYEQL